MNDDRRKILERLFDDELAADDPIAAADDAEARVYLAQLALLRELSRRHDPASTKIGRRPTVPQTRFKLRSLAITAALAASFLLTASLVRKRPPADRPPELVSNAPAKSSSVAVGATVRPRAQRPSMEVELYRWANAASPRREDEARSVLSHVDGIHARPASREVLALELANSPSGLIPRLPRSRSSHATSSSGSNRKPFPSHRHRSVSSPRA